MDPGRIRRDFPILSRKVHGKPLAYLDNAATSQKPQQVIDAVSRYYSCTNANIQRGVHLLSVRATDAYEATRERVQQFVNATRAEEIVFVRSTTEGINLVAQTAGRSLLNPGDEVIVSQMEHHSNIVPWQMLCQEKGARLRVIPVSGQGEMLLDEYEKLLSPRTRIVAVTHVSNVLGTINPVRKMVEMAHGHGALVLLDGAQAAPHLKVDVQELDCDFYCFSGHKVYGPTGIGILYGKWNHLESMPPYQGGGEMIRSVSFEKTTYTEPPHKFEGGTPNIAGGVALAAALDYLENLGLDRIAAYENELLEYATSRLSQVPGLRLIGTAPSKAAVLSFVLDEIHPHDMGTILDLEGVAIRTGHHCAQPLMDYYGLPATARASLAFYNTREEIDAMCRGLEKVIEVFE
ncbi:MAG: cysteine desulfurase [Candidatus Aminicenantes bacterium]|nr:cysteine desulfurase [Candidatus Aminicenantes bacterium]